MKRLVSFLLAAFSASVFAGSVQTATVLTNGVAAAATNTINADLGVEGMEYFPLQVQFNGSATGDPTNFTSFQLQTSLDGVTFSNLTTVYLAPVTNGTVKRLEYVTNNYMPVVRVASWANTNDGKAMTNLVIKYWKK